MLSGKVKYVGFINKVLVIGGMYLIWGEIVDSLFM